MKKAITNVWLARDCQIAVDNMKADFTRMCKYFWSGEVTVWKIAGKRARDIGLFEAYQFSCAELDWYWTHNLAFSLFLQESQRLSLHFRTVNACFG